MGATTASIAHTWALNEAAIEKGNRERMLEVVTEVDGRPLTSFGCDGVVLATPTGSTAYAFSAGGPVVWPEVEALLMVPISAHALFAKPLVVSPSSRLAVEILTRTDAQGVLWCDGRRTVDLPPGARVEVTRSGTPVRLARTHQTPFSDGWSASSSFPSRAGADRWSRRTGPSHTRPCRSSPRRSCRGCNLAHHGPKPAMRTPSAGKAHRSIAVIQEIRIRDLGVITEATLPLGPGLQRRDR